jgi:hypothetical protein
VSHSWLHKYVVLNRSKPKRRHARSTTIVKIAVSKPTNVKRSLKLDPAHAGLSQLWTVRFDYAVPVNFHVAIVIRRVLSIAVRDTSCSGYGEYVSEHETFELRRGSTKWRVSLPIRRRCSPWPPS